MEEIFKNPAQFSKGINLNDLMTSQAEFHLDLDFKTTKNGIDLTEYGDMMPDDEDDDSDIEDVFENVEKRAEKMLLSSPEYLSFEELAAKMVDVPCRPSGAVKITILEEDNGDLVSPDAEVMIHYAAYWEKAKMPFDSSLTVNNGNPMTSVGLPPNVTDSYAGKWGLIASPTFDLLHKISNQLDIRICLDSGRCLPGLALALTSVRGPTARIVALLQPEVLWGAAGAPPRIRPEPALFVLALYSVSQAGAQTAFNSLPTSEQTKYTTAISTVHTLRGAASDLFQQKRYTRAIARYQQAMHVLSLTQTESEQEKRELKNIKIKLFVNLAVCYYKLNKPQRVLDMCDNVDKIVHIETHCKALFYKGKGYEMLGKLETALGYYKKALKLEPNNKEIGSLLAKIDGTIKKGKESEVEMWQKAFSARPIEKRLDYKVNEEFENDVRDMCEDLAGRYEYTKVELPVGLLADEVSCLRSLATQFQGLRIEEDGKGRRKRVSIIKTV